MNKKQNYEKIKLLLVEDDEDFAFALVTRLVKRGFEVVTAASAEEALERFKAAEFEVVVVDIKLPGTDGISFLSELRKINKDVPAVVVTGYASLESAKQALKLKASDYLLKPLEDIDELIDPVIKAVRSYRLFLKNMQLTDSLKQKVQELERSENRYKNLFESATDIICTVDLDGVITSANGRMEEVTRYTKKELVGRRGEELLPLLGVDLYRDVFRKILAGKSVEMAEVKIVDKNGEIRLGEVGISPIIEGEAITGAQCVVHDITERKKAEAALRESEAKLKEQKDSLEQKNIALREVLEQIEIEKKQIKSDILENVEKLLLPALDKLRGKASSLDARYIDILQRNLEELTSAFGRKLTARAIKLTPREIEICNMIKSGLTSKEMSRLLNVSLQTIERHRNNIREKLGLVKKGINLNTYLQML